MNTMDRSRFFVGTYILQPYAHSEKHIRELAECGIDFVVGIGNNRPVLDLFAKYGVGAIVSGVLPGWWGGDGQNAGKMAETNPLSRYEEAAAAFEDHPAIWGIDTGDEPSALDFPHYGKVLDLVSRRFPRQLAYLNLYPNYASVSKNNAEETINQLGTPTYAEHIKKYCENIGEDYICYDYYMYAASVEGAYENLHVVSDACLRTGRRMWIVLQVNSLDETKWISENQLRFQAYSAMAFGTEAIIWACYTAGWWHNQVLDDKGEKTQQYDKLQAVNAELHTLGETYMKYRRVSTHFIGFSGEESLCDGNLTPVASLSTGVFNDLRAENGENLLAGQMVSRAGDGSYAIMLCGADDPHDHNPAVYTVSFRADNRAVFALAGDGPRPLTRRDDGSWAFTMRSCEGVLLIAR
jgi:hypothetical protein